MKITANYPKVNCQCLICYNHGTLKKNIGDFCYDCIKEFEKKLKYPEYVDPMQNYLFLKLSLEKEFSG